MQPNPQQTSVKTISHSPRDGAREPAVPGGENLIEWWWVRVPASLRRYSVVLADGWLDGIYLTAWPQWAIIVPLAGLVLGLIEGATHWSFLLGDTILGGAHAVTFTELLPFMVLAAAVSALSANAGVLLTVGYALGDFLVAGPAFGGVVYLPSENMLSHVPFTAIIFTRAPQLLSYALLLLLTVVPTLCAKYLLAGLRRFLSGHDNATAILRGAAIALLQGALVYAWTQAAPLLIRVFWGWIDAGPPLAAAYFLQQRGGWVVAAAVAGAVARAWLLPISYREASVRQRLLRLLKGLHNADLHPAFTRRIPLPVSTALVAAFSTLLASGFIGTLIEAVVVFLFLWFVLLAQRALLPRIPLWAAWTRLIVRIPLILRLLIGVVISYYLGQTLLVTMQYQEPLVKTSSGTFQPLLISMSIILVIWMVLVPHQLRQASAAAPGVAPGVQSGQPGGQPTTPHAIRGSETK